MSKSFVCQPTPIRGLEPAYLYYQVGESVVVVVVEVEEDGRMVECLS